jgi:hypothetical protein
MNRGYNEERFRPLENDPQNQPETSKTAQNEPASRERVVDNPHDTDVPESPQTGTEEAEKEGGVSE